LAKSSKNSPAGRRAALKDAFTLFQIDLVVTLLVVPFATVAGVLPAVAPFAVILICAFVVRCCLMRCSHSAVFKTSALNVRKRCGFQKIGRASWNCFQNTASASRVLRLGLPLPREIESPQEDLLAEIPGAGKTSRVGWPCTPRRRGNYSLNRCHIEGASPLGFWSARTVLPLRSELRVYPDLMKERKNVAALFLNRGTFGIHAQRQVGKGRDFEKLREYIPGDSYEDIHWKATAKRGRPVTKIFQIERTQEIYVILDASRLAAREVADPADPNARVSTLERFISAALVLALAAERQGICSGCSRSATACMNLCAPATARRITRSAAMRFTRCIRKSSRPITTSCSLSSARACAPRAAGVSHRARRPAAGGKFRAQRRTRLPPASAARQHDPAAGRSAVVWQCQCSRVDDLYRELGGHIQWQNLLELGKKLKSRGVQFSLVQNEKLSADVVTQYLNVKRRQLV